MKNITEEEAKMIDKSLEDYASTLDKMVAMLLREGQTEAPKPIIKQLEVLQKLREKVQKLF